MLPLAITAYFSEKAWLPVAYRLLVLTPVSSRVSPFFSNSGTFFDDGIYPEEQPDNRNKISGNTLSLPDKIFGKDLSTGYDFYHIQSGRKCRAAAMPEK